MILVAEETKRSRIARAHRMGQRRHVHVYLLVTEGTIEEGMLATLSAKRDLALAVLDQSSEKTEVALTRNIEELKRKPGISARTPGRLNAQ
jgi:SNF2 family DNA or RNA helicase